MVKSARNSVGHSSALICSIENRCAPGHADRRDLLDRISNFLLDHELSVSPANLALAREIVSGGNPELSRWIAARRLANQPVTQAWLDGSLGDCPGETGTSFAATLAAAARAARAANEPLSLAFCDIDRLAAINDSHGGDTGDRVIQAVARALQRIGARDCHSARHGCEDLAMLFRGLVAKEAAAALDQARERFAQRKLIDRKSHLAIGSVTFSGGVIDALAYADLPAALAAAAQALLAAKAQGRNRIVAIGQPVISRLAGLG